MTTNDPGRDDIAQQLLAEMRARPAGDAGMPREMRLALMAFRGLFLLVALGLMAFVPVTVYRCRSEAGAAACEIQERTFLGLLPGEPTSWTGIASATSGKDRWAIRLLGRQGEVLHEREQSAVVGTSMVALARRISATAQGGSATPWTAWQWPLPVALFAGASLAFAASGPLGWLLRRRRAEAAARGGPAGIDLVEVALPLGMLALAAGAFWLGPVVLYRCSAGDGGAACRVEWRAAGLVTVEAVDLRGVASATSSSETVRRREVRDGRTRESTETRSTITFLDAGGSVLFEDELSGAVGTSGEAIAAGIEALASGQGEPVAAWRAPWLPLLFGTLMSLLAVFPLLSLLRKLVRS